MSRTNHREVEEENQSYGHGDQHVAPKQPPEGESNFGDSSGPLFSLYSKISKDEDNKMTDRWQKDADGILFFTGLFSAAVAALLAVSVQDLRPNSQDTSAFYLANIYQVLADPNATVPRTSIRSPVAIPPSFSPPRYAIWVNSLWFLSLVTSLVCALLATSSQQWARRYIRFTQPLRASPEKRARMRAFFAHGVKKMYLPSAVESLPALIHLSLLLFFAGLVIFLFNTDQSVFISVTLWIGLFLVLYVWVTLMPIFRHDSPFYTPFSFIVWSLHAFMLYTFFTALTFITSRMFLDPRQGLRFLALRNYYGNRVRGGAWKGAKDTASKRSSDFDLDILDWTLSTQGEDDMLERFLEAIPGFLDSKLVKDLKRSLSLPQGLAFQSKFVGSLCGFLGRSLLSNSVSEEVKNRRLIICMNTANAICNSLQIGIILSYLSRLNFDQTPQTVQTLQILAPWCTSGDPRLSRRARDVVSHILPYVRDRDDRWIALAKDHYGLAEDVLRDNIAHSDNSVLLAILIHVTRQFIRTKPSNVAIPKSLVKFDINDTQTGLKNEFCALWNEIILEAGIYRPFSHPVCLLREIRHLYTALHSGTDAAPTSFDDSTPDNEHILLYPSSYPFCTITNHRTHNPNSTPAPAPAQPDSPHISSSRPSFSEGQPIPGNETTPQQAEDAETVSGCSPSAEYVHPLSQEFQSASPTTDSTVALHINRRVSMEDSHSAPLSPPPTTTAFPHPDHLLATITPPNRPRPPSVSAQRPGVFPDIPQPIASAVTLHHPRDTNEQQDIDALHTTSDITQILSTANRGHQPTSDIGPAPQINKASLTGVPPIVVSTPLSSPIMTPALHSSVISVELPSSDEPAFVRPHRVSRPAAAPSSSLMTTSSDVTQVIPMLDTSITTSTRAFSVHERDETPHVYPPVPVDLSLHTEQPGPSTCDISEPTLPPRDSQNYLS